MEFTKYRYSSLGAVGMVKPEYVESDACKHTLSLSPSHVWRSSLLVDIAEGRPRGLSKIVPVPRLPIQSIRFVSTVVDGVN